MSKKNPEDITDQQRIFCREYLKDLNGKQAAIRAGYAPHSAEITASKLLSKSKVQEIVQELMDKRSDKLEVTTDTVLRELLLIAKADISKAYDEKGDLLPIHEIPEDVRRCIAGIEIFAERDFVDRDEDDEGPREKEVIGHTKKIKFWDKPKALELLGRHLKLFTDKIEHSGEGGGPVVVAYIPDNGRAIKDET